MARPLVASLLALAITLAPIAALAQSRDSARTPHGGCIFPPPPPPPPIEPGPRGRLTVRTSHEARVYIDGALAGVAPIVGFYLDAGRHQVRLVSSCGEVRRTVRVPPGQSVVLSLATCPTRDAPELRPIDT